MRAGNIRSIALPAAALLAAILSLAGCSATAPPAVERADYSQGLNRYYQGHPMCLWPASVKFPVVDAPPDQIGARGYDSLAAAGLLVRTRASRGAPPGSATFDLTPEGRSALNPDVFDSGSGNFCYGRRKVVSIDSARQKGTTKEIVDYHFAISDPAPWAMQDAIQAAFPQLVSELASPHQAEVTLLDTVDGWEVTGAPALIQPEAASPPASTLAKAKTLLQLGKGSPSTSPARSSF
jgi:hypothetical protein